MNTTPATANVRYRTLVARADGSPITAGTVNLYLVAVTGANAGKWWKNSDESWNASETVAGAMTHKADGQWALSLNAAAWVNGIEYREYAKESGNLHTPTGESYRAEYPQTGDSFARIGASGAGLTGITGATLAAAYDAAMDAASATDLGTVDTTVNAIKLETDGLQTDLDMIYQGVHNIDVVLPSIVAGLPRRRTTSSSLQVT